MKWIINNKAWLFSGVLVAVPLAIFGWLLTGSKRHKQVQKSGKNSVNLQAGGDIKIESKINNE